MAVKKGSEMQAILDGIESSVGNKKKHKLTTWDDREMGDIFTFGLPGLDAASNVAGHPRGKIIEIYGPESSGKSYAAYKMIAAYQSCGMNACLIDVEHSFWGPWAAVHGVDINKLVYGQNFSCGEEAMNYAKAVCESKQFGIVVIDSIAALLPKVEAEGELDDKTRIGAHAAMMSRCLRVLADVAGQTGTTIVCINQIRNKIGVMFGNPEETPGGKALKFYAGQRIELRRINVEKAKIDGIEKAVGIRTKVKFVKNKVGMPFGEDEFTIYFIEGINSPETQLVNLAIRLKVIPPRKASEDDDDKKSYYWKIDGELVDTGCGNASELVEWFGANECIPLILEMVVGKAKEKGVEIPEEVLTMCNVNKENQVSVKEPDSKV